MSLAVNFYEHGVPADRIYQRLRNGIEVCSPKNAAFVGRKLTVTANISSVNPDFVGKMKVGYEKGKGFFSQVFRNWKDYHEPDVFLTRFDYRFYVAQPYGIEFVEAQGLCVFNGAVFVTGCPVQAVF